MIDIMIEIYLKSIENNTDIINHSITHSNVDMQKLAVKKLALALKANDCENSRINGVLITEILNISNEISSNNLNSDDTREKVRETIYQNSSRLK